MNTNPTLKLTGRSASQVQVAQQLLTKHVTTTKTTITFHNATGLVGAKFVTERAIDAVKQAKVNRFTATQKGQLVALRSILRALEDWSW